MHAYKIGERLCRSAGEVESAIAEFKDDAGDDVGVVNWPREVPFPVWVFYYFYEHSSIYVPETYCEIHIHHFGEVNEAEIC